MSIMKLKVAGLIALFVISGFSLSAKEQDNKFKVSGNCSMCEKRIEKAAMSVEGVSAADWNKETKLIEVSFDKSKTDVHKIHAAIAKAGHDTEMHKADDKAYNALPGCCKYDRLSASDAKKHGSKSHSGCSESKKSKKGSCCK